MVTSHVAYLGFLALLALERVGELLLSARNARVMRARGGREVGHAHYQVMRIFHTLFLLACAVEVLGWQRSLPWFALAALVAALGAQALRYWAIVSLGPFWNVRIIVIPGVPPVLRGPYRWLRHPNYVAVIVEMVAVPLLHNAYVTAVVFSLGNAWLLWVRIRAEERALGLSYENVFADTPRFLPLRR